MVEGGKTPFMTTEELEHLGYKIVVYPLAGLFSANQSVLLINSHQKILRYPKIQGNISCHFLKTRTICKEKFKLECG